jgi:hypothetical protein
MENMLELFSKVVIDLQGFNQAHFGIFPDHELNELNMIWCAAGSNPNKFISFLSPRQKTLVSKWACERTAFNVEELIFALEGFLKELKKIDVEEVIPIHPKEHLEFKKKKRGTRIFRRK